VEEKAPGQLGACCQTVPFSGSTNARGASVRLPLFPKLTVIPQGALQGEIRKTRSLYSKHLEKAEDSSEPEPSAVRNWQRMVTYNDEPASDQSVSPRPYNPVAGFQDFEDSHTVCLRHASSFLLRIHAGLSGVVEILVAFSPDEVCTALTARAPSTRAPQRSAYRKKIKPLFQLGTEDSANRL
jgi:hypothetical protein